jgi:hypothetical protein
VASHESKSGRDDRTTEWWPVVDTQIVSSSEFETGEAVMFGDAGKILKIDLTQCTTEMLETSDCSE